MAICIARVTAGGHDLRTDAGLDLVALGFLDWRLNGASDIGAQTASVLRGLRLDDDRLALRMADRAKAAARAGRAGNGALMRTGVVGLVALDDPYVTAEVAQRVAALTHADDRCVDSSVLWSEAVRVAVVEGRLDVRAGLWLLPGERRKEWARLIEEAEVLPPSAFTPNGFTVTAFQAAWSAIHAARGIEGPDHVEAALQTAIAIGNDTDTVAAIAGALLGARYGVSGLPSDLARRVHGWPGMRGRDLVRLGLATATGGMPGSWPESTSMLTGLERPLGLAHPADPDVILGTEADLARCGELGVTAVVSLSRVGAADIARALVRPGKHAEVWLIDSEDPSENAHLAWTLTDAAQTVAALRDQGERVLLHCVGAVHRTPAVALAYAILRGHDSAEAAAQLETALGRAGRQGGLLWRTAKELTNGDGDK